MDPQFQEKPTDGIMSVPQLVIPVKELTEQLFQMETFFLTLLQIILKIQNGHLDIILLLEAEKYITMALI